METTLKHFFTDPQTIKKRCQGPIAVHFQQYAVHLHEQGYSRSTGRYQLGLIGDFSDWAERRGIHTAEVDSSTTTRYVRWRRRKGKHRGQDQLVLTRLLNLICPQEAPRTLPASTAVEQVIQNYVRFLEHERGVSKSTVVNYVPFAQKLLMQQFPDHRIDFSRLSASDITEFVKQQAQQMGGSKRILLLVDRTPIVPSSLATPGLPRNRFGRVRAGRGELVSFEHTQVPSGQRGTEGPEWL